MDIIKELFALPIGLQQVYELDGMTFYGSQTLNDKFIQAIKLSKRGKIIKSIETLVRSGVIIPCFADAGILTYLKRRVSKDTSGGLLRILRIIVSGKKPLEHPLDNCFAFYDFSNNKILILISNHITEKFSMTVSNESLAIALTHEMMHMYAHRNPNKFLSFFKDELYIYYKNYFTEIFKLKDNKELENIIESIYKYLFLKIEMSPSGIISLFGIWKQLQKLKPYSELNENEFKIRSIEYVRLVRIFSVNDMSAVVQIIRVKYVHVVKPLYIAYAQSFGKIPPKGCLQELISPSEVICGYLDSKVTSKTKNAIQSLLI